MDDVVRVEFGEFGWGIDYYDDPYTKLQYLVTMLVETCKDRTITNIEEVIDKCDGVIDFSRTEVSMEVLDSCVKHKKPLMLGTTGFTDDEEKKILEASKMIAI